MNDIKLKKSGENTYDWVFQNNDLVTSLGIEQTKNRVRHALLLQKSELNYFPYADKGVALNKYFKYENIEEIIPLIEEEIKITCKELEGIENAIININLEENYILNTEITVIRDDGVEVTIYAT